MNKHLRDKDSSYFHNSLRKYGKDNFIFEIVEECRSREELDEREEYWIVLDDTINRDKGFNLIKGAIDNPDLDMLASSYGHENAERVEGSHRGHRGEDQGGRGRHRGDR